MALLLSFAPGENVHSYFPERSLKPAHTGNSSNRGLLYTARNFNIYGRLAAVLFHSPENVVSLSLLQRNFVLNTGIVHQTESLLKRNASTSIRSCALITVRNEPPSPC